ncbi:glycine--tRNA ligase subunit beta [Fervidibacillus halotolerans]|uniref:Glycine--tRNA ligase beta subunit n=1 Tax=Fervidibacillus halotolerans TaxID=2980027 RepID=A0A9E8LXE8_9BACI|nr:glycine--tRNA ligase subunit beta [Fervidibacillus halotolerans]WAA11488.1 glycine--tRNA ligase subunit beta [Fervidibacillus halotolerans]
MQTNDFLLEIGLEEVPARFIHDAQKQLVSKIEQLFQDKDLSFGPVHSFSTPRRFAVLVENVAAKQLDIEEEVKGPSKKVALDEEGNWTKAAIGFTKGQGKTTEDIYFKEVKGIEYVFVKKHKKGEETVRILQNLDEVITSLTFAKNMKWGNFDLRYIRPIRWLVALYGNKVIDLEITNIKSGRTTYGHRFLGGKILLKDPREYEDQLLSQHVIVDQQKRKEAIVTQLQQLEEQHDWVIPIDEDLLEEVTNLVEYPTVLHGSFDEEFLQLPNPVLITTMKEHQRYFPVQNTEGKLLPYFVTVRNGDHRHLDTVRRGNEKVLRARLKDAVFFYQEDQKLSISNCLEKLKHVVYHDDIGTYSEKLSRVRKLSEYISSEMKQSEETKQNILRTAEICKFDLVTQMVGEFPELQGIMGEVYAQIHGENKDVAKAIREHYLPKHADDELPESEIGIVVSIADKIDTIVSLFAVGLIPTGSQDPYGLRRQAAGVVRILAEHNWQLSFEGLLNESIALTGPFQKQSKEEIFSDLQEFFRLRFKHLLDEKGIRYDITDAVLSSPVMTVRSLIERAELLQEMKDEPTFKTDMEALSRVIHIAEKCEVEVSIQPELFENETEHNLYEQYVKLMDHLNRTDSKGYYRLLIGLKDSINDFFDRTMVMVENEQIRNNRLSLLKQLSNVILSFAHFQHISVK